MVWVLSFTSPVSSGSASDQLVCVWARWLKWLEREFTDWKVRGSNSTSASRLPLSWFGQLGTMPALVLPSGDMADRHQKDVTAERFFSVLAVSELFRDRSAFRNPEGKKSRKISENSSIALGLFCRSWGSSVRRIPRVSVNPVFYLDLNCTQFADCTHLEQLNLLHQAASCFSCYDIRDIAIHVYTSKNFQQVYFEQKPIYKGIPPRNLSVVRVRVIGSMRQVILPECSKGYLKAGTTHKMSLEYKHVAS
ncbi:hypothetical protein CSKR_105403 [Clonorchis sinensis]|uniref:Uncharacterized protein n=1 Tax=Clonorchis sinensis TaxID=79923 RepID=A0A419Q0P1_CLOSI|nr:hypothetical protein CSKR_105403 [Clonorchis sinensis]